MQRSPEHEQWARELLATDDPEVLSGAHSRDDAVTVIGTDEDEWIEGASRMDEVWRAQAGTQVRVDDVRAYEEGSVPWMAGRVVFVLPDGSELPARLTGVAHREDGEWKIVQSHASVARPPGGEVAHMGN